MRVLMRFCVQNLPQPTPHGFFVVQQNIATLDWNGGVVKKFVIIFFPIHETLREKAFLRSRARRVLTGNGPLGLQRPESNIQKDRQTELFTQRECRTAYRSARGRRGGSQQRTARRRWARLSRPHNPPRRPVWRLSRTSPCRPGWWSGRRWLGSIRASTGSVGFASSSTLRRSRSACPGAKSGAVEVTNTTETRIWRHFRWPAETHFWRHFRWPAFVIAVKVDSESHLKLRWVLRHSSDSKVCSRLWQSKPFLPHLSKLFLFQRQSSSCAHEKTNLFLLGGGT